MSLGADSRCFQCHLRRYLDLARKHGDEQKATAFAKELMRLYLSLPEGVGTPRLAPEINRLLWEFYGLDANRMYREKKDSNRFVLERMDKIRAMVEQAEDPLYAALQFAVLGNYLDFAALQDKVSFAELEQKLEEALEMDLDKACYRLFRADLAAGKKLLYLTDNAGEIGFDRIFAQQIQKAYPDLEITFCVRGGPVVNDATREDAMAVGIEFPVIDSGCAIGGTEIEILSAEAKKALEEADVIIAKGMGNTETMFGCGYPVYYAFLVKCELFVRMFDRPLMTPMFVKDPKNCQ